MKIKVFSDDAIQRIASGNEPTQTLISMDVLKNVLNPHQLRNVLGGSGDDPEAGGGVFLCKYGERFTTYKCSNCNPCEDNGEICCINIVGNYICGWSGC